MRFKMTFISVLTTGLLITIPLSGLLMLPFLVEKMTALESIPAKAADQQVQS